MGDRGDGFTRHRVELGAGPIHYSEAGAGEPLVFVHGFAANGRLWTEAAARLAGEFRCILPDWPLGSHPEAMSPDADQSARGIAELISELLAVLELDRVTIVGNDSGGAVSQILVTERPERVARLVLTNCDCFEKFPPGHFKVMSRLLRLPGAGTLLAQSMRVPALRRSPLAYGALTEQPIADELLRAWTRPQIDDAGVRRDGVRFFAGADSRDTLAAAEKLPDLEIPVLLAWGTADRFFTIEDARRLAGLIPDARLVEIPGGRTFVPLDRPGAVADAIAAFIAERPPAGVGA